MAQQNNVMLKPKRRRQSQWLPIWRRLKKSPLAMAGLVVFALLLAISLSANLWLDYEQQAIVQNMTERLLSPNSDHIFGTDHYGRDEFARIVFGARISLLIALLTVLASFLIGGVIGAVGGYYGGWIDNVLMRFMDVLLSIPSVLLAIAIVAALGNSVTNLIIAMAVPTIPRFAYIMRSKIVSINRQEFIEAAKAYGTGDARIIWKHIIPNTIGPIIVQATTNMARSILMIAALSYVGLGLPSSIPEWGSMISDAKDNMRFYPYLVYIPGLAIVISVLSLNLVGDGLRDALDPKLKN